MKPDLKPQHEWLQQLVGEWVAEGEASMGPDKPAMTWKTEESVRSLGGAWVVCEGSGEMPEGGPSTTIMTLGYDPTTERFTGTFIGSMMTYLWVYDGALDASGKRLELLADGPDFETPGKIVKYKDTIEIVDRDTRTLTSHSLGDDGQWHGFMTARYRRTKAA